MFDKRSLFFTIFTCTLISIITSITLSQSPIYAQSLGEGLVNSTTNTTFSSNETSIKNATDGVKKIDLSTLKAILATPFTSITAISLIPGIQVSGVNFGDTQISVTLKQIVNPNNATTMTTPVTVTAVRIPVSDLEDLLSLVKDSGLLGDEAGINIPGIGNANPLASLLGSGSSGSMGSDQNSKSIIGSVKPFQLLKDIQFGTGSVVGGDWKYPRTITMGFLDIRTFFGIQDDTREPASAHIITVFVVPYVGVTNLGSVPLH